MTRDEIRLENEQHHGEVVERVAKALIAHAPHSYDPASDDMTVEFAIKLADNDAELDRLRAELAESEASCDRLRGQYDDVRVLNMQLAANHASIVTGLKAELAESEKQHTEACEDRDQWKRSCQAAIIQRDAAVADNAAKDARIAHEDAQTKIVLDSYAEENQRLHDMLDAKDAHIAELENARDMMGRKWSATHDRADTTTQALEAANTEIALLKEHVRCVINERELATDMLHAAKAERDALREALEPFARYYELNDCEERYRKCWDDAIEVPIADLRKARAALNPSPAEDSPSK